ncbi:hypothetical protein DMH04_53470 [Kibdelosporangium aridum]|uniref:Uncharacterized protein n=1 Tax=Kibdelosporangium aridum TaxID=2030 RepID=A0A428Y2W1_KIBAR|nr:hypothetical protein [Kibdelosporangium aridum]RSM61920.1 hypothetical protein DMH04_53470 [Kibdelosporangium aridum]
MAIEIRGNGGIRVETDWRGYTAGEAARRGAARGVVLGAEHVRAVSVNRAPLDTGALRNSATASHDPDTLTGAVSYDTPMPHGNTRNSTTTTAKATEAPRER